MSKTMATILEDFGNLHLEIGQVEQARQYFEQAIRMSKELDWPNVTAHAQLGLGRTLAISGKFEDASTIFKTALRAFENREDRVRNKIYALFNIGELHLSRGQLEQPLSCFEECQSIAVAHGNATNTAAVHCAIGRAHARQNARVDYALALEFLRRSVQEFERAGSEYCSYNPLMQIGKISRKQGRYRESLQIARRCLELRRIQGMGLAEEYAVELNTDVRDAVELGVVALLDQAKKTPGREILKSAFSFVECSRGLVLAERLLNRDSLYENRAPPELFKQHCFARKRVSDLTRNLLRLMAMDAVPETVAEARGKRNAAYQKFQQLSAELERSARKVTEIISPEIPDLDAFQKRLSADTAFLHYMVTKEKALVLAITREKTVLHELGSSKSLMSAVEGYLDLVSTPGGPDRRRIEEKQATHLYDHLIAPIEEILEKKSSVVISPDGLLAFLPIEALLRLDKG
jgi:tetratricopeptide (TPR) repeat protein